MRDREPDISNGLLIFSPFSGAAVSVDLLFHRMRLTNCMGATTEDRADYLPAPQALSALRVSTRLRCSDGSEQMTSISIASFDASAAWRKHSAPQAPRNGTKV